VSETFTVATGKGASVPLKVVGSFHTGVGSVDNNTVFASLPDVQKINETPSQISDIAVKLQDVTRAAEVAESWSEFSRDKVQSWDQLNLSIMSVFKTQNLIRAFMTGLIIVVAAFGIYNVLNILVSQKKREIAILRSIGYEARDILSLFLVHGLLLGSLGGLAGVLIGYLACIWVETLPNPSTRLGLGHMMVSFDPEIYWVAFAISFCAAAFSSVFPALAAGKMTPMEIFRSEVT
jgi:lipoprotein-releasing system permease protein